MGFGLYIVHISGPEKKNFPIPQVEVMLMQHTSIRLWSNFSGRLKPIESVDIRPLVGGKIDKILFSDGDYVTRGQTLFVIDPRSLKAAMEWAEGELAKAKSVESLSNAELLRKERLLRDKLISKSEYDTALNQHKLSVETVKQANSAFQKATIDFDNAYVKSPINGIVGRAELTVGNTVTTELNSPKLAHIITTDKYYVEFDIDESTFIEKFSHSKNINEIPIKVEIPQLGNTYFAGHMSSFDNTINEKNGSVRSRAMIENTDGKLFSGMFVNIDIGSPQEHSVLLVPQNAIKTDLEKKYVYVIDNNQIAEYREVKLGDYYNNYRVVTDGLSPGDRVVTNGILHIIKNRKVAVKQVNAVADAMRITEG